MYDTKLHVQHQDESYVLCTAIHSFSREEDSMKRMGGENSEAVFLQL